MRALADAIKFAVDAHGESLDRGGDLAIMHPLTVMMLARGDASASDTDAQIVAILHDVVEDTPATLAQIKERFGNVIADAVDAITRRKDEHGENEKYFDYIERVKANEIARRVKLCDLEHNSSPARMLRLPVAERTIIGRYRKAEKILRRSE